jgi:hypothetical protein
MSRLRVRLPAARRWSVLVDSITTYSISCLKRAVALFMHEGPALRQPLPKRYRVTPEGSLRADHSASEVQPRTKVAGVGGSGREDAIGFPEHGVAKPGGERQGCLEFDWALIDPAAEHLFRPLDALGDGVLMNE